MNAGRSKNIERIDIDWGHDTSSPQANSSPATLNLPAGLPALAPPPLVRQAPHSLTKIFSGIRFTVFAITSFRTIPTTVRLIAKLEGVPDPEKWTVDVTKVRPFRDTNEHSIVPVVHTLAARKLIMELDDGVGPLPTPVSGDALLASEDDLRKAGIVRLGLTYQLVSKHTSFVAVQRGDEQRGNRGRGSGSMAWARSRLRQTKPETQEDRPTEAVSTFLDDLVHGASSFIASVFRLFGGPVTPTTTIPRPRPRHRPKLPGTFEWSDSDRSESSRGRTRRRTSSPLQRRNPSSRSSADSFSTLSSLEGSTSCSSCWTTSRPPSPLSRFHGLGDRAPSPDFLQDPSVPDGAAPMSIPNHREPITQEVYDLFQQMDLDGSFSTSSLLLRLVGDEILAKADELGTDKKVWTTVVVAAYMKIHLQGEPDLLELVLEKAREFVEAWPARDGKSFDQMVREVVALLNT